MTDYSDERFQAISDAAASITEHELESLLKKYDRRLAEIDSEIEKQIEGLAVDNHVDYQKAHEMLTKKELQEFRWSVKDYINAAEANESFPLWKKQLQNASRKAKISRLEKSRIYIEAEMASLYADIDKAHGRISEAVYSDSYLRTAYLEQDRSGVYATFAKPDFDRIQKTAAKGWTIDGKTYSERIWENRQKVAAALETELTNGLIRGDSVDKMVKNLTEKVSRSVPKSQIERLIRTESTFVATSAQIDSAKELGADGVKFIATLDEKTCEECGPLDGMVYFFNEAKPGQTVPPVHPNCRCCLAPAYDDNNGVSKEEWTRRARDSETGKSVDVPEMPYDDWMNIYADPDRVYGPVLKDADVSGFKVLKTIEEIEAFMEKNTTIEPPMDAVEKRHYYNYTVDSSKINAYTRHLVGTFGGEYKISKETESVLYEQAKSIDSVFKRTELKSDVVLFRAAKYNRMFHGEDINSIIGKTYFDGAYISTSPSLGSAIHVAKKRNSDTILIMKIHSGFGKGAYVDKISEKKGIELEFLIGRFEKYIVESVKQNVDICGKKYIVIVVGDSQ